MKDAVQDDAIRGALLTIAAKHPQVADLVELVYGELDVTPAFFAAYGSSKASYGKKSLVIRALLADPSAYIGPEHAGLTESVMVRLAKWILLRTGSSKAPLWSETAPKAIATQLGVARTMEAVIRAGFVAPWAAGGVPTDDPRAGVVRRRVLTIASTEELIAAREHINADWYFRTGSNGLDLANALIYLAALFEGDREGGRVQNLLPLALTERWGLRRLSVPAALLWCDVITLMHDGVIPQSADGAFADAVDALDQVRTLSEEHRASIDTALERHRRRWRFVANRLERYQELRGEGLRGGTYDTSIAFNLEHLLASANPELSKFASHYMAADPDRWIALERPVWTEVSASIPNTVAVALKRGLIPPVQVRSLGNILCVLRSSGAVTVQDAWNALPPVARAVLGSPMPRPAPEPRESTSAGRSRAAAPSKPKDLPLLAEIEACGRTEALLVLPGYRGEIPHGKPCFVPAAFAAGWVIPEGVTPIGDVPLPWNESAIQNATRHLEGAGFSARAAETFGLHR